VLLLATESQNNALLDYTAEGCKTNSPLREILEKLHISQPKINKIQAIYESEAQELENNALDITHKRYSLPIKPGEDINFNTAWRLLQSGDLPKSQVFKLCASAEVRKHKSIVTNQRDLYGNNARLQNMNYEFIKFCAEGYRNETENNRILLKNINNGKLWFLPYNHMLTKQYIRGLIAKFSKLKNKGLGVTLTLKNSPYRSVYQDRVKATKCFDKLMKRIRRHCAKNGLRLGDYFGVIEIGDPPRLLKNGWVTVGFNTHIHVIFYNLPWISHKWLQNAWLEITGDSQNVFVSNRNQKAKNYVIKYLSKALKGDLTPTVVLNWACGKRMWISSNHLFEKQEKENTVVEVCSPWIVIGLVNSSYVGQFEVIEEEKPPPIEVNEWLHS